MRKCKAVEVAVRPGSVLIELCIKRCETSSEVRKQNHLNKEDMSQHLDGLVYLNRTCHNIWTDWCIGTGLATAFGRIGVSEQDLP